MIETKKANEINPSEEYEAQIARYHNLQLAKKIQLNSAYGALANAYFRWYDLENAEAITKAGQLSIRWIEIKINEYLNDILKTENKDYVLAADTDSVYVCLDELVKKIYGINPTVPTEKIIDFLDRVSKDKIQPFIDESYAELAEYVNAYEQRMFMKRENIANKAIWTAKKRYIMNVYDSEGVRYNQPELKMMGIEAIRSSTPSVCRDYIKQTRQLIMNNDEQTVQQYIEKIREEFKLLKFEDIAFPRSVSLSATKLIGGRNVVTPYADKASIYRKGTPIQVKGALLYNHYLKQLKLDKTYEEIKDGEKIKFCYLKTPNVIRDSVISCPTQLPSEFNLNSYLDYETQFVKGFLDPIDVILNVIGWHHEKRSTLEDFFS
jgi:DNA polymerase elongation subunit (family B)